jgi:hypothetical protein
VETLFFLPWNRRSLCRGIRVLFAVESLFTLAWNIHAVGALSETVRSTPKLAASRSTVSTIRRSGFQMDIL